ncbi:MAG: SAM-dependent methyltransferase [Candidatus Paceibacteria bacterium]|jgi:SAM-dependent methyltransferase
MYILDGIKDKQALEAHVGARGGKSQVENQAVFDKWFKPGPRRRTMEVIKKYGLNSKTVIDIGSGVGNNLVYMGTGSYGVEINPGSVKFCTNIGLDAKEVDMISDDVSNLPKVDNAIAWAIMEHVENPHRFLRNIHAVLNPGGNIFLYVPTVPVFIPKFLPMRFRKYWNGHLHGDHVNAFSGKSLKFMCERAGFETVSYSPGFYGWLTWLNYIPGIQNFFDGCLYVGKAIPEWQYPIGSTRKV